MGLFRRKRRPHAVREMLRLMEDGLFEEAARGLPREFDGQIPPPHALWRLGRWCLDKGRPKLARRPLELFLQLYPAHQDRTAVARDLAAVLVALGRRKLAAYLTAALPAEKTPAPEPAPAPLRS
jgi:hypothetical protein